MIVVGLCRKIILKMDIVAYNRIQKFYLSTLYNKICDILLIMLAKLQFVSFYCNKVIKIIKTNQIMIMSLQQQKKPDINQNHLKKVSPESHSSFSQRQEQQVLPAYNQNQQFNINQILQQIKVEQELTTKQLQNQIRQLRLFNKQISQDLIKIKKQIQLRPNSNFLTENTIMITSTINSDPVLLKMLQAKQSQARQVYSNKLQQQQDQQQKNRQQSLQFAQYKTASKQFSKKLAQINQSLSILLNLIKKVQKQKSSQIFQLKYLLQQKTISLQDQLTQFKQQQITQKLSLIQKIQLSSSQTQQKIRSFQTKQSWQLKSIKTRLQQTITKQYFNYQKQNLIKQNKNIIQKFQSESKSLINPQKIKQIQSTIKQNKQYLSKMIIQSDIKIDTLTDKLNNEVVSEEFYKKQRVSLQKRISTINKNFEEFYSKVVKIEIAEQDHEKRLSVIENQFSHNKTEIIDMKKILKSLHISQDIQKMLSQIDPQKILQLQSKIQSISAQNINIYKQLSITNHQIQKILAKFQISGVMVPNSSRNKQYQLQDLRQIIDQYFTQNRYANKINKLQNDVNQFKLCSQSIKILQKKIARIQKQSQYERISMQFKQMEEYVRKEIKVFSEKFEQIIGKNQINKHFFKGLASHGSTKNIERLFQQNENNLNENTIQKRRKSLISQSSIRKTVYKNIKQKQMQPDNLEKNFTYRPQSSHKNILPLSSSINKQISNSFLKNTISSTKKNLLKSNHLFM